MKTYRLYLAKPLLIFYLCFFAAWMLASLAGLVTSVFGLFGPDGPPFWLFILTFGVALIVSYQWLRFPFEIRVEDNSAEFRSLFRTTIVPIAEIKSVAAKKYALGLVDVVHACGTVHLLNQMDGFHDFILTIKSANSAVEIKGC